MLISMVIEFISLQVCHIGSIKQSARLLSFTKLPASPRTPRSPSSMVAQRAAPAPPTPEVLGADGGDAVDTEELGNGDKALCRFDPKCTFSRAPTSPC